MLISHHTLKDKMPGNTVVNSVHSSVTTAIPALLVLLIALFIAWIVASIPLYVSSKFIVHERSNLGRAMFASLVALIAFVFLFVIVGIFIPPLAPVGGFIGILLVIMGVYGVGLLKSFIMSLIAFVVFILMMVVLLALGITFSFFHFAFYPGLLIPFKSAII